MEIVKKTLLNVTQMITKKFLNVMEIVAKKKKILNVMEIVNKKILNAKKFQKIIMKTIQNMTVKVKFLNLVTIIVMEIM